MKQIFGFWAFAFCLSLFIQMILIPYLVPSMNGGLGLLKDTDSPWFHQMAVELAQNMQAEGIGVWSLSYGSIGIPVSLTALFYYLFTPAPWVVLPFNSLCHAISCFLLGQICITLGLGKKAAFGASLVYLFWPTSYTWTAQIHRDGTYILGIFLFLYHWVKILLLPRSWKGIALHSGGLLLGSGLVSIARPQLMVLQIGLAGLSFLFFQFWPTSRSSILTKTTPLFLIFLGVSFLSIQPNKVKSPEQLSRKDPALFTQWHDSPILPKWMENRLYQIATTRNSYNTLYPSDSLYTDRGVQFLSAKDMILYIPQAIRIGLFYPSIIEIFGEAEGSKINIRKRVAGFEMLFGYLGLMGFFIFLYQIRRNPLIWCVLLFCLTHLIFFSLSVSVMGALYRYRMAHWMLLVAIGYGFVFKAVLDKYSNLRKKAPPP